MLNFCLRQLSDSPHSDSHPWNIHALIRNLLHVPYSENPLKGNICACSAKLPSLTATCIATVFITFSRIAHSLWNEHFNILKFLCNSTSVKKNITSFSYQSLLQTSIHSLFFCCWVTSTQLHVLFGNCLITSILWWCYQALLKARDGRVLIKL